MTLGGFFTILVVVGGAALVLEVGRRLLWPEDAAKGDLVRQFGEAAETEFDAQMLVLRSRRLASGGPKDVRGELRDQEIEEAKRLTSLAMLRGRDAAD